MATESELAAEEERLFRKRMDLLSSATLREPSEIGKAIEMQDAIRRKAGKWNASKLIRKWRDAN